MDINNNQTNQITQKDVLNELIDSLPKGVKLFSITKVMNLLGLGRNALYEAIQTGKVHAIRTTQHKSSPYRIPRAELIRYIKENFTVQFR